MRGEADTPRGLAMPWCLPGMRAPAQPEKPPRHGGGLPGEGIRPRQDKGKGRARMTTRTTRGVRRGGRGMRGRRGRRGSISRDSGKSLTTRSASRAAATPA